MRISVTWNHSGWWRQNRQPRIVDGEYRNSHRCGGCSCPKPPETERGFWSTQYRPQPRFESRSGLSIRIIGQQGIEQMVQLFFLVSHVSPPAPRKVFPSIVGVPSTVALAPSL